MLGPSELAGAGHGPAGLTSALALQGTGGAAQAVSQGVETTGPRSLGAGGPAHGRQWRGNAASTVGAAASPRVRRRREGAVWGWGQGHASRGRGGHSEAHLAAGAGLLGGMGVVLHISSGLSVAPGRAGSCCAR